MGCFPNMLLGLFVGGKGRRMGGVAKGLLPTPDGHASIVTRWQRLAQGLMPVVLVGDASAYAGQADGMTVISDQPAGIGPLGGLRALAEHAGQRRVLAVACDMPFVSAALLTTLANTPSKAVVVAPRDPATGKWQPMFGRYDAPRLRPHLERCIDRGERSFQALFAALQPAQIHELPLSKAQRSELRDWDYPADVRRGNVEHG